MTQSNTGDLLRWVLGAALVGGAARGTYNLYRQLAPKRTLRKDDELYNPEIELPVHMTPAQYKRFQELRSEKLGSAWNPTLYTLGAIGGGMAGWRGVSALIHRARKRRLNQQLDEARKRLDQLADIERPRDDDEKTAAVWEWLDKHAEEKTALSVPAWAGALGRAVRDAARKGVARGRTASQAVAARTPEVVKDNPYLSGAVGVGGLATVGSALPGVRAIGDASSRAATGIGSAAATMVGTPLRRALVYTLGPVAAISLLVGLSQGRRQGAQVPERAELKAFRRQVRREEGSATPHFRPRPIVRGKRQDTAADQSGPRRIGITTSYDEVTDDDED